MTKNINFLYSNGRIITKVAGIFTCSALIFASSCSSSRYVKMAKKQTVTASPNPIEVHGNKAEVDVTVSVDPEIIKGKYNYAAEFIFSPSEGKAKPEQLVRLPFVPGQYLRYKDYLTAVKTISIPWQPGQPNGALKVRGVLNEDRKFKYLPYQTVAIGFITTFNLAVPEEPFGYIVSPYARKEEQNRYVFYFNNNSATMKSYAGADSGPLADFIAINNTSKHIVITAHQSPDEKPALGKQRAEEVKEFYISQVDKVTYRGESSKIKFDVKIAPQDLKALLSEVKNSPMPAEDKAPILQILNSGGSYQTKVQQLKKLKNYKYLQDYIYPSLRRVNLEAIYERPQKMNFEIALTANRIAKGEVDDDMLTAEEFAYAAELTPLVEEKERIYKAAVRIHRRPQDAYNLGVLWLNKAKKDAREEYKKEYYQLAIQRFKEASGTFNTAKVYYNLASAYQLSGDIESANQYYDVTTRLQDDKEFKEKVISARAAMLVNAGKYKEATSLLATAGEGFSASISRGLISLQNQQYIEAVAAFTQAAATEKDNGLPYYLMAVTGARSNNEELVYSGLQQAVAKNRTFVEKAVTDLEFRNFKKNQKFTTAIM